MQSSERKMMNVKLQEKCDLFIANRDAVKDSFKWQDERMSILCSIIYTGKGLQVDTGKMKECEAILKKKTDVFSDFRSNMKMTILANMAKASDPEEYFNRLENVYQLLKKNKWFGSEYKVMAAMVICENVPQGGEEAVIERTQAIYQAMKQLHPFLTSDEDISFAAMLAMSDQSIEVLTTEMENCYQELKGDFFSNDAVQSLSHILALYQNGTSVKCQKVRDIYSALKEMKRKFGTGQELAALGALSMLDLSPTVIAKEIADVDDFLKQQKGFGALGTGSTQRLMYASLLVMDNYMPESSIMQNTVLGSTLAIIIAEQIAMIAIMAAVAASSAANN